jgi:hypothetical protein
MKRRDFIRCSAVRQSNTRRVIPATVGSPHFRFYAPKEVNLVERGAIWISENS